VEKKPRQPFIPVARSQTIRQKILSLLGGNTFSARDLSAEIGVSEKEIYYHLEHIQKSTDKSSHNFMITPALCKRCNFVFRKRDRLTKPGKCPICRGESIQEPQFSVKNND